MAFTGSENVGSAHPKLKYGRESKRRRITYESCISEPSVLRSILSTIENKIDGTAAAASVVSKRRRVLFNALEYAVELGLLAVNPLLTFKWRPPRCHPQSARVR